MATFTIDAPNGKSYTIEGDNAEGALAALKKHLGETPAPDKYQQAAIEDRDHLKAIGAPEQSPVLRRALQGATFGGADELLAGARTPAEMIRHGTFNPVEGYQYAKARENLTMEDARKNTGALGTVAEIGGGVLGGTGLSSAGLTLARPGMGFLGRTAATAGEGAGYGALSGALDGGDSFSDRFNAAGKGALVGGLIGGALPAAGAVAGTVAAPVLSNIRARVNPAGVAESQLARALQESGQTAQQVEGNIAGAHAEGQGMYTAADAMGNAGQRMLSGVTRAPGPGRQAAVEFLENRQGGQGRRVSNALAEGFDSPQTAAQTEAALTRARGTAADAEYGQVRSGSNPVDLVGPINHIDSVIGTGPGQHLQTPNDSIEGTLRGFRERLSRVNPDDFSAVERIRHEMADAAQSAMQGGQGNRARMIRQAVGQLDAAMENASSGYRAANANFAQASRNIDAVQAGRTAAMRGRTEDTIPAFNALQPQGQQAFRSGYVDPLIEGAASAAPGVNKARPLLNDAFQAEAGVMAPGNPLMQRRIGRENTMFETRRQATGGSQTVDNLADAEALHVDPSIVRSLLHGHFITAGAHALSAAGRGLSGNTAAVREQLANLLLSRGQNPGIAPVIQRVEAQAARRHALVTALTRGGLAGTGEAIGQRK